VSRFRLPLTLRDAPSVGLVTYRFDAATMTSTGMPREDAGRSGRSVTPVGANGTSVGSTLLVHGRGWYGADNRIDQVGPGPGVSLVRELVIDAEHQPLIARRKSEGSRRFPTVQGGQAVHMKVEAVQQALRFALVETDLQGRHGARSHAMKRQGTLNRHTLQNSS